MVVILSYGMLRKTDEDELEVYVYDNKNIEALW